MDMHGVPKWALYGGVAVVVLLLLRARSGGSGGAAVAADKSQAKSIAQQLQAAQLAEQFANQKALDALRLQVQTAQAQLATDFLGHEHRLATNSRTGADKAFMCPVGKERIDPTTGQTYCRTNAGGGITLGSVLGDFAKALPNYAGSPGGGL